jgi:TonB family protein
VEIVNSDGIRQFVFIPRDPNPSGGGGGGGNHQSGPIRHAKGVGSDSITLRVLKPTSTAGTAADTAVLPEVLLDAKPLSSGNVDEIGLPVGGVSSGTSTGPGSGGGIGEGVGTGIGPGRGPGIGAGSGVGTGGRVYRLGGSVTAPRVITEVKPTYTNDALTQKIQGTVVLELVVRSNGRPSDIRIVRSLDPGGLDEQAIIAAEQWRFEPGRLSGKPVDVVVTVMLDFWIR